MLRVSRTTHAVSVPALTASSREAARRPRAAFTYDVPMQLHVDRTVDDVDELLNSRRAERFGAEVLLGQNTDPDEPWYVLIDLTGHPFCVYVH